MIKKILLKIAFLINKHYKTIEIKHEDFIKYGNGYYGIVSTSLHRQIGHVDSLNIEAHNVTSWLSNKRT